MNRRGFFKRSAAAILAVPLVGVALEKVVPQRIAGGIRDWIYTIDPVDSPLMSLEDAIYDIHPEDTPIKHQWVTDKLEPMTSERQSEIVAQIRRRTAEVKADIKRMWG